MTSESYVEGQSSVKPSTFIGQHILQDQTVVQDMVEHLNEGLICVEIGPGPGVLTKELIEAGKRVVAYEVDERWEEDLDQLSGDLEIRWGSILDAHDDEIEALGSIAVVGNIPFHISEPLMIKLMGLNFDQAILLVGMKLARTLSVGNPDQSDWSMLSMLSKAFFDVHTLRNVPRTAFDPIPRTDGAVITIDKKDDSTKNRTDAETQAYRAIVQGDTTNQTIAKSLKSVSVDRKGLAVTQPKGPKKQSSRTFRRKDRRSMREFEREYNYGDRQASTTQKAPNPSDTIFDLVKDRVRPDVLSKQLSGLSNQELRSLCSAISTVINYRTKT